MKGSMLNAKFIMDELEEKLEFFPPFEREGRILQEIEKSMHPNTIIELAYAPEDIQERIRELDDSQGNIWEIIQEEAKFLQQSSLINKTKN